MYYIKRNTLLWQKAVAFSLNVFDMSVTCCFYPQNLDSNIGY